MKKVKYLAMLLAAGMFAACSDNLEDTGAGNAGGTTPSTTDGYVKVSINTPTTSGTMTRATSLDDGTDNEYEVKNGILVFFKTTATTGTGTPEATAEFVKAYDVTLNYAGEGGSDNEVTTRHTVIGEAPMAGTGEQVYALAILNKGNLFRVNKNADENGGALQVYQNNDWADVFDSSNKTVTDFQKKALTVSASDITSDANGFLMLNAPLATTTTIADITDLSKVQTLVPVTVYDNEEAAQNGEAADIYVERVVAKVTLKGFTYSGGKYTAKVDNDSPFKGDKVQLEGWTLSVTNKTTKAVRDISGLADWVGTTYSSDGQVRFLSTTKIDNQELYRIHWGIDCNYKSVDIYTDAFNILSETNKDRWTWEVNTNDKDAPNNESNPVYCLENTMDYNQMNQNQTTTLFIKTTYYADPSNPDNAQDFFMYGTQEETYLTNAFLTKVKEALSLDPSPTISLNENATGGTYTYVESGGETPTGKKDVKTLFTLTGGSSATLTDEQAKELISQLGEIKYYEDGATYYNSVLVRHFDDSYTDVVWDPATPTYTEKHLGRYGVLRNNWYEINVASISGPGEPEIPEEPNHPDDPKEAWIKCNINVLSWAKRKQDVHL